MITTKEKQILNIIKYTPPVFIVVASILITLFLYFDNKATFLEEKNRIESEYINNNKEMIKTEVTKISQLLYFFQKSTEKELKDEIKQRVYEVTQIAKNIYDNEKNKKSKEEILVTIKNVLNDIRFKNGRGYYFIFDEKGNKLLDPIYKENENKNFLNYLDSDGHKPFEVIAQTIKEKAERFDEYDWINPNNKEKNRKISFYKYFEPLNIAIGTGEYYKDFEKEIQSKALRYINFIRHGKSGYIFVLDYEGTYLCHINKGYVGENVVAIGDVENPKKVLHDTIEIAKNGEGFYSYLQLTKPDTKIATNKISFIKGFPQWQWVIGTGFYEDDVTKAVVDRKIYLENKFNEYIKNVVIISIVLTVVLLLVSIYVSRILEEKFVEYRKDLEKKQSLLFQQSKMASMGEMIGNIAHQWRQPLSAITTAISGMVLQKQMDILTDEFFYDTSSKINSSAQHLSKTIDDFRNFFSPEKIKIRFKLRNTFDTALDLTSAQFNAKDIKIVKNIEKIELYNFENELVQALMNILNNARDELIKKPSGELRVIFIDAFINKDSKVVITIKDNAGGIPPAYMNRIFEPYFTTKHKSQGTGIGLYMVEEIVNKHLVGEISVQNREYEYENKTYVGAEFKIVLDLVNGD